MESHDYCPEEFVYETEYPAVTELTYINIFYTGDNCLLLFVRKHSL